MSKHFEKKNINNKKAFIVLILIFGIIIIAYLVGNGLKKYINIANMEEDYKSLASQVIETSENNENKINFEKLKEINSDIIAWVQIDGTNINYPIVQTSDNNYYLTHNFYKEESKLGTIFLDYENEIYNKNLIIYGYNTIRKTMFSELKDIYNGKLGEDVNITIYSLDRTMYFKVFSCYYEKGNINVSKNITEDSFKEVTENLKQKSENEFTGDYTKSNQILTLLTYNKNGYYYIYAELEKLVFTNEEGVIL